MVYTRLYVARHVTSQVVYVAMSATNHGGVVSAVRCAVNCLYTVNVATVDRQQTSRVRIVANAYSATGATVVIVATPTTANVAPYVASTATVVPAVRAMTYARFAAVVTIVTASVALIVKCKCANVPAQFQALSRRVPISRYGLS